MATITREVRTTRNVWQFDVTLGKDREPTIIRIYGDVTNREALNEAIDLLLTDLRTSQGAHHAR